MSESAIIEEGVRHLATAVANALLYAPEHPQVRANVAEAGERLRRAAAPPRGETRLVVVDDLLFHDGTPFSRSLSASRLVQAMKGAKIGYLHLLEGVTDAELHTLVLILSGRPRTELELPERLRFGTVELDTAEAAGEEKSYASFEEIPAEGLQALSTAWEAAARWDRLTLSGISAVVGGFLNAFRKEMNPFLALAPLRSMDEYTFAHSVNVCILNIAQGMSLGLEGQLLHDLGLAGLFHDMGKLHLPRGLLAKSTPLSGEEWRQLQRHPVTGAAYLLSNQGVPRLAVLAAYEHHMRHDLAGYPTPPPGWKANIAGSITAVSDCFDALRTKRVYQDPSDAEKAAGRILEVAGTQLNPALALNFVKVMKEMGGR